MKTTLTIEESARLIELGVDAKLASMVSWKQTENWQRKSVLGDKEHLQLKPFRPMVMGFERFDCKDIFTLTDILSILPKEFKTDSSIAVIVISINGGVWGVSYEDCIETYVFYPNQELIDALYQLLIWAIENNHVNLKTDKK